MNEQQRLAIELQGKTVRFAGRNPDDETSKVIGHDGDGMIELDNLPGHFHPSLFIVVE